MALDSKTQTRPWIGILFECCSIYSRIYRPPHARVYRGRCPRCMRSVQLHVDGTGTEARQFRCK